MVMDVPQTDASSPLSTLAEQQLLWATRRDINVDRRLHASSVEANLFAPLHPETERDFAAGQGDELSTPGQPGKLASLISSAALAVNVFDPWRGSLAEPLCRALGIDTRYRVNQFEAIHPTGLRGTPPHLDVELKAQDLPALAIESKFTEPYRAVSNRFRPSYFSSETMWRSLPSSLRVARSLAEDESEFGSLHVAQLIKHALGLTKSYGSDGFVLMYLWYRVRGLHGDRHQLEVERFSELIGDDFVFRSMTYQELLGSIEDGPEDWLEYVRSRYLPEGGFDLG